MLLRRIIRKERQLEKGKRLYTMASVSLVAAELAEAMCMRSRILVTNMSYTKVMRTTISLSRGYIALLFLTALLICGSYVVVQQRTAAQARYGYIINLSGRQRMLSQRISLFSSELTSATDAQARETIRGELSAALDTMAADHEWLARETTQQATVAALYTAPPHELRRQVLAFLAHGRVVAGLPAAQIGPDQPDLLAVRLAARGPLLTSLETAVAMYEAESEGASRVLQNLQIIMFIGLTSDAALCLPGRGCDRTQGG
jgi:hypothetical protein